MIFRAAGQRHLIDELHWFVFFKQAWSKYHRHWYKFNRLVVRQVLRVFRLLSVEVCSEVTSRRASTQYDGHHSSEWRRKWHDETPSRSGTVFFSFVFVCSQYLSTVSVCVCVCVCVCWITWTQVDAKIASHACIKQTQLRWRMKETRHLTWSRSNSVAFSSLSLFYRRLSFKSVKRWKGSFEFEQVQVTKRFQCLSSTSKRSRGVRRVRRVERTRRWWWEEEDEEEKKNEKNRSR